MTCPVCQSAAVEPQLDVGAHPVSSRFARSNSEAEVCHSLVLGQCADCCTIQLMQPVPHDALVPPYDWLFAREPEEHLDTVVEHLMALPGLPRESVIAGLTSKDDSTLDRFRKRGFSNVWRVDLATDLGVTNPCANIETVQKRATSQRLAPIGLRRGLADVLIVRHILEHAEDLAAFVEGCASLVKPGGHIMVELPDCSTSLRLDDYAMIWEEHALYFVPETFAGVLGILFGVGFFMFARWLVQTGRCSDMQEVFRRYLTEGKPGFVPHRWAALGDAVRWIQGAGGMAVIAHPARYKFSANEEYALFSEFKTHGGRGVEVLTGSHSAADSTRYAKTAREFQLLASRGSDFHSPEESRTDLGKLPLLSAGLTPVWSALAHRVHGAG